MLYTIECKIQKNKEINDYLEEMAKTIYNYWFVQFDFPDEHGNPYKSSGGKLINSNGYIIPEDWHVGKVKDVISNICTGLNPRDNFILGSGDIKYITVKNLTTNGTLDFSGCDTINESARAIVHARSGIREGDILLASIAPLGRCYLIQSEPVDWDINESVFSIRANDNIATPTFLYLYFMSDAFIKQATSSSTIIITCHNANKQIKESEKSLKQQEEQFANSIMLQKEQYEKENLHNKEMLRIQKRPYLVIDKSTSCMCHGSNEHHMRICFKNKGNGSAFNIQPDTKITASNENIIIREEPIQDPIVMVNELCETKWRFDSPKRDFLFSMTIKFEDMSGQLYRQTFILTFDSKLYITVTNYAEPQLISE